MFLSMSPVSRWCWPISVPGIGVCTPSTGSILCYLSRYYFYWRLGRLCPLGGCNRCFVWVCEIFCRIWCCPSGGYVLVSLHIWRYLSNHMTTCQRRSLLPRVYQWPCQNGSSVYFICAALSWPRLISGFWWGGPVISIPLIVSVR